MESKPNQEKAAALALRAFLRRLFSRLANEAQADSLAYRRVLEELE